MTSRAPRRDSSRQRLVTFALALLLVAAPACRRRRLPATTDGSPAIPAAKSPPSAVKIIYPTAPGSFVKLVERARHAVVHLRTDRPVRHGPADWFSATAQSPTPRSDAAPLKKLQRALGSGLLVGRRGLIITNAHVIGAYQKIWARFSDDRELVAKLVGSDARLDLALLRVDATKLGKRSKLRLGSSKQLQSGEWLIALGNPFGLQIAATVGIVSSLPRGDLPLAAHGLWGYVQSDLRIHPGNSGGPVLNMLGEVVGIATAVREETRGIGFVLPIDTVRRVQPMLEREGKVVRAWVGMYIGPVSKALAKQAGMKAAGGALVDSVINGGPAARAGLRRGDIILSFAGRKIERSSELPWLATVSGVGRLVKVKVWRAGQHLSFDLRTEAKPE